MLTGRQSFATSMLTIAGTMLVCGILLTACSQSMTRWEHDAYVVRQGDTLYAIAWRYGLDHRALARWNGLGSGDVIYPGQQLSLRPRAATPARAPVTRAPASSTSTPPRSASRPQTGPPLAWQWPASGPVLAGFGDPASVGKGIDIGGRTGQAVFAAADGRVVYAGSGLVGYGKLIIIKHDDTYLSAYGHNDSLLAVQGQEVKRGQRIADMGRGPGRKPMLHFEIRVNGQAVDPVRFLPGR